LEDCDNAFGGMAVPERWNAAGFAMASQDILRSGDDFGGICAD
jgi:hypothetical protein